MIRKLLVNDGRSERELLLDGTIVVGRDPSCHINDLDPLLSRRHAEFVAGPDGAYRSRSEKPQRHSRQRQQGARTRC